MFGMHVLAHAQKPKLYMKAYGGVHAKRFEYKQNGQSTEDLLAGWQGGFGMRVSIKRVFGEMDFDFIRSYVRLPLDLDGSDPLPAEEIKLQTNSLNIPFKLGYIPVKGHFLKWYLYTGISSRINTKTKVDFLGEEYIFKPKELGLRTYTLDWNVGTQFDVGWLNIDVYYGLGLTNSGNEGTRTNSNEFLLNLGFLF